MQLQTQVSKLQRPEHSHEHGNRRSIGTDRIKARHYSIVLHAEHFREAVFCLKALPSVRLLFFLHMEAARFINKHENLSLAEKSKQVPPATRLSDMGNLLLLPAELN